jgi:hypothetical protein
MHHFFIWEEVLEIDVAVPTRNPVSAQAERLRGQAFIAWIGMGQLETSISESTIITQGYPYSAAIKKLRRKRQGRV